MLSMAMTLSGHSNVVIEVTIMSTNAKFDLDEDAGNDDDTTNDANDAKMQKQWSQRCSSPLHPSSFILHPSQMNGNVKS
jgi:hypothetical protein